MADHVDPSLRVAELESELAELEIRIQALEAKLSCARAQARRELAAQVRELETAAAALAALRNYTSPAGRVAARRK